MLDETRPIIPIHFGYGEPAKEPEIEWFDFGEIARNPKNHLDQWLVAKEYYEKNFEPIE